MPRVAVTGHRPTKIGGYDFYNKKRINLRKLMKQELSSYEELIGLSGMALGVDQDYVHVLLDLSLDFEAFIPFIGQESSWPMKSQLEYKNLLSKANIIVDCEKLSYSYQDRTYSGICRLMQNRNEIMVKSCDLLLAFWDGSPGGTANCVNYAKSIKKEIKIFDAREL